MSFGGSTTSTTQVPAWLENAARANIGRADVLSTIGYTPYYGPDVAALTPMQVASMQGTNQAANAFGLPSVDPMAGMPQAQDFGGVQGYSSGAGFDRAVEELRTRRPGQYEALIAPFINPVTGAAPSSPFGPLLQPPISGAGLGNGVAGTNNRRESEYTNDGRYIPSTGFPSSSPRAGGTGSFGLPDPMSGSINGVNLGGGGLLSGIFGGGR